MKKTTYISLIIIAVGLSVGITALMNKDQLGATITDLVSTDQLSDFVALYNTNNTALNNAIHWLAGADYLYASSSPTFGIILGPTSSSTIGALKIIGNLNVTGNSNITGGATSTTATSSWLYISDGLTIGAYTLPVTDGTVNYVLKTDGVGTATWQEDLGATAGQAWDYDSGADAMVTTSTKGIYITASSSFHSDLRIDASATTTGSLYIGGDLFVLGDFIPSFYYATNTPDVHTGTSESSLFSTTIYADKLGANGTARLKAFAATSGNSGSCWMGFRFGGETIATSTLLDTGPANNNIDIEINVRNRNSTASQISSLFLSQTGLGSAEQQQSSSTALTIDTTSDQTFEIRGDCDASGTITLEVVNIELFRN